MIKDKNWLLHEFRKIPCEVQGGHGKVKVVDTLTLIDQLDEPRKVIIPQFVADHIRFTEDDVSPIISMGEAHISKELNVWLAKTEDYMTYPNQEKFMRAWLDGYEVEKEKLYRVLDKEGCVLVKKYTDETSLINSTGIKPERFPEWQQNDLLLTEKEIKDYDERFWQFAVEVAE